MERTDYLLKNTLVEIMRGMGTHFEDKKTGKDHDHEMIKEILKDEKIKDRFYMVLENELIKALEEKYPQLKGTF